MKNRLLLGLLLISMMTLTACNSMKDSKQSPPTLPVTPKPANTDFDTVDFEQTGTISMPKGADWKMEDGQNNNSKLDMVILTKNTSGDFTDKINEFTKNYTEKHKTDASQYKLNKVEQFSFKGMPVVRVDGEFDNGTAFIAREYLFFTQSKVAILVSSIDKKYAADLNLVDYIANTFTPAH